MTIPAPEPGLVIFYGYLWSREHEAGATEARKDRPSVIILSVQMSDARTNVLVLPITHSRPAVGSSAVEIPIAVGRAIGLDEHPSWVVVSEGNEFVWPGFDLAPVAADRFSYGFLPPRLFAKVVTTFRAWHESRGARLVPRG